MTLSFGNRVLKFGKLWPLLLARELTHFNLPPIQSMKGKKYKTYKKRNTEFEMFAENE